MRFQDVEVRIQDVNPENEKIFENGWMYVSNSLGNKVPQYFAPYFINECINPGLSRISRVLHLVDYKVEDLLAKQIEPPQAPSQQHHSNWHNGLIAIRYRAVTEEWKPQSSGKLFYLDRPESFRSPPLTKQIYNNTNPVKMIPPTVPIGFTLTFGELLSQSSWSIEELTSGPNPH